MIQATGSVMSWSNDKAQTIEELYESSFDQFVAFYETQHEPAAVDVHVRMIPACLDSGRPYEKTIDLILDSGADVSVLPCEYKHVGTAVAVPSYVFRDAQGGRMHSERSQSPIADWKL